MVKILFIAYHFPPMGGPGVQRSQKFVQCLPSEGFLPVVVTGPRLPDGRGFPQDSTSMSQIPANVSVYHVKEPVPQPVGKLRSRLKRWLGLRSSFSKWWIRSATETAGRAADGAALIFATMSPFESVEVATLLSKQLGIPWIADLRDPWALDEIQLYPTLLHRKLEKARMERLLSTAALIVMNTPEATAILKAAFPKLSKKKKILTVTNGFDREDFENEVLPRADSKFRIVHSGGMLMETGLRLRRRPLYRLLGGVEPGVDILTRSPIVLQEAIERWCACKPEIAKELEIVFAGKITQNDQAMANKLKISKLIKFTGYLPHSESLKLIRTADLLFLPMHNLPPGKRSRSVPAKTYEYIASGRPILAAVPEGDARDFLIQCGTGLVCRPDDVPGMIQILDRVYTAWKEGRSIGKLNEDFVSQFERRNLGRALADGFRTLVASARQEMAASAHPSGRFTCEPETNMHYSDSGH